MNKPLAIPAWLVTVLEVAGESAAHALLKAGADAILDGKLPTPGIIDLDGARKVRDVMPDPLPTTEVRTRIAADIAAAEAEIAADAIDLNGFADTDPPPPEG